LSEVSRAVWAGAGSVVGAFGRGPARLVGLRGVGLACPSGAFAGLDSERSL